MALDIIGSGFGRTGTRSLKAALERLGFGPCHHMEEVFHHPEQVPFWQRISAGEPVDWAEVFHGYRAQVDWPGAHVWRELAATYPKARVIHSHRPEEKWWASFSETIAKLIRSYHGMPMPPHIRAMLEAAETFVAQKTFDGTPQVKEVALAAYRKRLADVKAAIPAARLLVFDVADGWAPLCRFLGVPAPAEPFPHLNEKTEFWERLGGEPA